jgi:tripartite ATP-independent transporter DctM subunit
MSIWLVVFFLVLALGVPVAFTLGLIGTGLLLSSDRMSLDVLPTVIFGGMDSFPLLAIPLFIMAGDLLARSQMLDRMIGFAKALVGPLPGGLAHVNIGSSMLFGGVTGVAVADTAAVGSTLVPAMVREGYKPGFAAAITAASSVMGAIIPPSVAMLIIVYIYGGGLSVGKLFLAGAVPGILIGLALMLTVALMAPIRNFPKASDGWSMQTILHEFKGAALGLTVPVIVIGGIIGGWFTATEAGAVAVAYALLVGTVILRKLSVADIAAALLTSAKMSGVVFILLATAKLIAWLLVLNGIPQTLAAALEPLVSSPQAFLVGTVILLLILGMVMEGVAAMIMVVPIIAPMAARFGVDSHHLALVVVMTVQVALITPPVALGLFIVSPFAGCTLKEASIEVMPLLAAIVAVILLVVFVPDVAMWLPNSLGY